MIRVVRVGGSLLDMPRLGERLRVWLERQSQAHHVLVAGGGALVEQVRAWHAEEPIDDATAHWLSIDLMHATAQVLHARLPELPFVEEDAALCRNVGPAGATVFSPTWWLRQSEPQLPGTPLPCSWAVTSDSIAGRLATALGADELVLLKSASPAAGVPRHAAGLARAGYVDAMFARLAPELPPTRIVDFRAAPTEEFVLVPDAQPGA